MSEEGYAFATVDPVPELDREAKTAAITLYVEPKSRVYVRRVNFIGTSSIDDEVLRREVRQLEDGYLSNSRLERSKIRLQRLPYIEKVEETTNPVPGTPDLVDLDFDIKEGLPGQFGGGVGYSQSQKLIFNGNFVHTNFMGSGNRVQADINTGQYRTVYGVSYTDPYTTINEVSRTISLTYRDITQFTSDASDFSTKTLFPVCRVQLSGHRIPAAHFWRNLAEFGAAQRQLPDRAGPGVGAQQRRQFNHDRARRCDL